MRSIELTPRWGAQIEGEAGFIEELERVLKGDMLDERDLFIFRLDGVPILSTISWDCYSSSDEVSVAAKQILMTISGCMNAVHGLNPLSIGTIYRFNDDRRTFQMSRSTPINLVVYPRIEDRISPVRFRKILRLSDRYPWISSCLPLFNPPMDWFGVYKAIEAMEVYLGNEKKMFKSSIINGSKLQKIKQMANSYRHVDNTKHRPPQPPIELWDAINEVRISFMNIVNRLSPP